MVPIILIAFLLILAVCTWHKPVYGIMCYYVIRMVIPSVARISSFSFNTIALGILLLFLLPSFKKNYSAKDVLVTGYIKSVIFIVGGLFSLTLLGSIPILYQWSALLQLFMTEILPSILLAIYLTKAKDYKLFCKVICVMAIFTSLYGIYTYVMVENPIFEMFNNSGDEGYILEDYATGRLGLESIAVGIYNDKIALSLISLLLFTFLSEKRFLNNVWLPLTLILLFVTIFLTTQRTALFCVIISLGIMFFDKENGYIRKIIKLALILAFIMIVFSNNEVIQNSFYSILYIFDDNMQQKLGIGGSSTDMRLLQFANGFDYLGLERLLQGEGYNFPAYYYKYIYRRDFFGMDPRFFGFESFLLKVLMSSGLIGIIIWFVGLFKVFKSLYPQKAIYDIAFFCSYILAILMTDTSASFYLFFFLLVLNSKRNLILCESKNFCRSVYTPNCKI